MKLFKTNAFIPLLFAILLILLSASLALTAYFIKRDDKPHTDFIFFNAGDIGCSLIKTELGKFILINTGNKENELNVIARLNENGVRSLALIIITDTSYDYIGNVTQILRSFDVEKIILPHIIQNNYETVLMMSELRNRNICTEASNKNYSFSVDSVLFNMFPSDSEYIYEGKNSSSTAFTVSSFGFSALFTSNSYIQPSEFLINNYGNCLKSEILFCSDGIPSSNIITYSEPIAIPICCNSFISYDIPDIKLYKTTEYPVIVFKLYENEFICSNDGFSKHKNS